MKNLIFLFAFMLVASFGYSQLKVVAPDGDVGIGTSTPVSKLQVVDDNARITITSTTDASSLQMDNTVGSWRFFLNAGGAMNIRDVTNGANAFRFDLGAPAGSFRMMPNGDVGIGTSSATNKLHVNGDIFATGTITPSDKRLKQDVRDFEYGLDELMQIEPISYKYNGQAGITTTATHVGVMAQDLQKIAPMLVGEYEHVDFDYENEKVLGSATYLNIRDNEIKYMIINAVKEQQAQIDELTALVEAQQEIIQTLGAADRNIQNVDLSQNASLAQNRPNPFNGQTVIEYSLPSNTSNAFIHINDNAGNVVKRIALDITAGQGQLNVNAKSLASGAYSYTLIVDGVQVDTKQMILAK